MQPIYNKSQRDVIHDLEAGNMDKNDFFQLMDEIIVRENLEGNTAADPKKKVRIMVCADFEDTGNAVEKFFHWSPVPMDMLPPFRLCHKKYWEKSLQQRKLFAEDKTPITQVQVAQELAFYENKLKKL